MGLPKNIIIDFRFHKLDVMQIFLTIFSCQIPRVAKWKYPPDVPTIYYPGCIKFPGYILTSYCLKLN